MSIVTQTTRKFYSDYVVETRPNTLDNQCSKRATVKAPGADIVVDPVGFPVVFDGADSYIPLENTTDIAGTTAPSISDGGLVGIVVGAATGEGHNEADVTITSAGVEMTILFADATIVEDAIVWGFEDVDGTAGDGVTAALAAKQAEFLTYLAAQRVFAKSKATVVDPTYTV